MLSGMHLQLHVRAEGGAPLQFNRPTIEVEVSSRPVEVKERFSITGLALAGKVLWANSGKPVVGAAITVDNKRLDKTDANGVYRIKEARPGSTLTLRAEADGAQFDDAQVNIGVDTVAAPTLTPAK